MLKHALLVSVLLAGLAGQARAVTIDTVPVGNAGNANSVWGYGAVAYGYRIGTTEVTVGQYTAFLNAVGATDTFGLYNTSMATDLNIAGIARSGVSGAYNYSVIGSANHPVTYVSWGDAARFANWMHNNQPTGTQGFGTTEDGAYLLNGAVTRAALSAITREPDATWSIPTENEWYKGAYHKNDGVTNNYWEYPTKTNAAPYSDQPPGSDAPTQSNTANFRLDDSVANGYDDGYAVSASNIYSASQNYLTNVAAYNSSTSPYGTFDQGGNVFEWIEGTLTFNPLDRGVRGGAWRNISDDMRAGYRFNVNPAFEGNDVGFRVAMVPEPSSFVLAALGLIGLAAWRRRKRSLS